MPISIFGTPGAYSPSSVHGMLPSLSAVTWRDMAEDERVARFVFLVNDGADGALELQRCFRHGHEHQLKLPSHRSTASGESFISPAMEVELHTAPKRYSPSNTSPSAVIFMG